MDFGEGQPNCNAFAERYVRSVKEECLSNIIPIGAASLRRAVREYTAHYHGERNHQGLDNELIEPPRQIRRPRGGVDRRERLGGMLSFNHRAAAKIVCIDQPFACSRDFDAMAF